MNEATDLQIEIVPHHDGPEHGYFWRHAAHPEWAGPEASQLEAMKATLRDLLYYAKIGRAFATGGADAANELLATF